MTKWLLAVVLCPISVSLASATEITATQTDWSGGPGIDGPQVEWGERFADIDRVSWMAIPGQVALASTAVANPVRAPFPGEGAGAIKIHAADIDLDGDTDVLGATYYGNELVLFINDGQRPPSWQRQVVDGDFIEALAIAVVDIDGDGLPDIIGGSDAGAEVVWWRNLGGSPPQWSRFTVDADVPGAHDVAGADLDGDGDMDIVGVSYETDKVLWWRNDGATPVTWEPFVIASDFDYPTKVDLADIDHDGDLDLFGVAWLGQEVAWWRNEGGDPIAWTSVVIEENFNGGHWVDAVDVDHDGWVDVVGAAMDLREIAWWRNDGAEPRSWHKQIVTSSFSGAVSTDAGDLDGDGDLDIAGAGWSSSGRVAWFENIDGNGLTWQLRSVDRGFDQSSSVNVADVDDDGALDLLGSSWGINQFAWWCVGEFVGQGWLTSSILDTGGTIEWVGCEWEYKEPESTMLTVEARSSNNHQDMGPWVSIAPGPGCPGLNGGARYLQYRASLGSATPDASPILDEISFTWLPRLSPAPRQSTGRVSP